ncbi:MAG: hypothetical protein CSA84_04060 [Actinomycetales bacterium]|nr:MAG: hypothetical protein CSA84_04060 [Actinomycetales bacterium]
MIGRWVTQAANTTIATLYAGELRRLLAIRDLRHAQQDLLHEIVSRNAGSEFGRHHRFGVMRSLADFREAVPLSTWDDYDPAIRRIAAGEPGVLTCERVRLFEPSSGSAAPSKLVPYTSGLRQQFQRGVKSWFSDLFQTYPGLARGRSYWSITPVGPHPETGGIDSVVPIGFEEDADYLGPVAKRLLGSVLAVSSEVASLTDIDEFFDATCQQLLAARDLSLVSIWNPTLFTIILDRMRSRADVLLGHLTPRRRRELAGPLADGDFAAVWPQLQVISCWADASAAAPARELAARFPDVVIQPKGLLATEGFVSVPLEAAGGAVLSARSHFFEFLVLDPTDPSAEPTEIVTADELEPDRRYAVVLTTAGGLYRYRLGDVVEVTGYHGALPVLRYVGRLDRVSDLVGEKLNEAFVAQILEELDLNAVVLVARSDHYEAHGVSAEQAGSIEARLRRNYHYDYARRLGQLGPLVARPNHPFDDWSRLEHRSRGSRLGDVKPTVLVMRSIGPGASGSVAAPTATLLPGDN